MKPVRLGDPQLPRKARPQGNAKQRQQRDGLAAAWLVDYGGEGVKLTDTRGNKWSPEFVSCAGAMFGSDDEGVLKSIRPRKYNPDGSVAVEGDSLVIGFLDADNNKPVILSCSQSLKPADSTFFQKRVGGDPNPLRLRALLKDPNGVVTGHVQVTALDGGTSIELEVGGGTFGTGTKLVLDYATGQIRAGTGGETIGAPLGDKVADAFTKICADLATIAGGLPVPILPPALQTFQLSIDAATSSATGGAPLLSDILKVR